MAAPTTKRKQGKGVDPQVVQGIAAELGETTAQPLAHLRRMLRTLGEERTRQLVQQAKAVEVQGGLLLPDSGRRRTLGGVFFKLAKEQATPEERARIWMPKNRRPKPAEATTSETPTPA